MTGKWTVTINGTGSFNSGDAARDADALCKVFVDTLKASGQTVQDATFCFPTCTDLLTGLPK